MIILSFIGTVSNDEEFRVLNGNQPVVPRGFGTNVQKFFKKGSQFSRFFSTSLNLSQFISIFSFYISIKMAFKLLKSYLVEQCGAVESDRLCAFRARLRTLRAEYAQIWWAYCQDLIEDGDPIMIQYKKDIAHLEILERQEYRFCDKIIHQFIDILGSSCTFAVFESKISLNKTIRQRYSFGQTILNKLRELHNLHLQITQQKAIAREERAQFIKNNKFNYSCLPVEDLGDDRDYSTHYYFGTVDLDALDLATPNVRRLRDKDLSILKYYRKLGAREPVFREQPRFKNIFLLDRIRSILESFRLRRLSFPRINLFRNNYSIITPEEIQQRWYDHSPLSRPITEGIPDEMEMRDLGEIEFAEEVFPVMPEDPTCSIYSEDYVVFNKIKKINKIEGQMEREAPHGDCDQLIAEQTSNVILTTHVDEPSETQPITVTPGIWEELCSPQKVAEYTQLMSRWQRIKTVTWSVDDIIGKNLFSDPLILPKKYIESLGDSPSCILFKTYAYFRSDIEIKIVVNTNKFHCGQLQASFYYGASLDLHYADRENVFAASQLPHAIIDAASASDAVLTIPYRHYKPLMATTKRDDDNVILDLGLLRLLVLNKLAAPGDDKPNIDVSVFMRFVKPSFHGMKPRDIGAQCEMMGMANLVKETANLVQQLYPDPQRDNPSDVIPPKAVVPWSAHSWCLSDVTPEPINPLRMQATGNTPHLPGTIPTEPEMTLKYIQEIYGLIDQITWDTSMKEGSILKKIPFSPVLDKYPSIELKNPKKRTCDIMPPVSVLANLFAYWRGSLEYRLDFVSTQFHTGRLIIAYLPRVVAESNPSITQLTYCDHVIVDLRAEKEVNYINGFLSDKPWYPRRSYNRFSTEVYPPGYIYIGVLTSLTATQAVSSSIQFNMYMRAGKDFEMHIPVAPSIGLSFNTDMETPSQVNVSYLPTYGPPYTSMYIGIWHTTNNGLLFRYGPGSDHVTQFNLKDARRGIVYRITDISKGKGLIHPSVKEPFYYLVIFKLSDEEYAYGAPFTTYVLAYAFASLLNEKGVANDAALLKMMQSTEDGEYVPHNYVYQWRATKNVQDFEFIECQAGDQRSDDCGMSVNVQSNLRSTASGLLTFGEQITSIKQLTRRYMPYCQVLLTKKGVSTPAIADLAIPVMPQGLDLLVKQKDKEYLYGNRIRDGPIPILASGYRFYRGSVRFRMIVSGQSNGACWVQHRPEYNLRSLSYFIPDQTYSEALYQPGYGYLIQLTQMNNVLEFEIPFYLPGQFGMLQRPNLSVVEDAVHYSLGTIFVGFDSMQSQAVDVPVSISLFYSMGDDMTFSVFQGFPPMMDLSVFDKPPVQAEMGVGDYIQNKFKDMIRQDVTDTVVTTLRTAVKEKEGTTLVQVEGVASTSTADPVQPSVDTETDISALIARMFPDLDAVKKMAMFTLFSNIIHCSINPRIETIAWSIANMFVTAGFVCMSVVQRMCESIKNLFKAMFKSSKKSEKESKVVSQGGIDEERETVREESAFVSTCIAGILAIAGATTKPLPKSVPDFAKYLYEGMPKFTLTANGLFIFLRNNVTMFKKIWFWLVSKFNSDYILYTELADAPEEAVNFLKQIQYCLDTRNAQRVRNEPKCTILVYDLANKAQSYLCKRAMSSVQKHMPLLEMYCKNIIKLRDTLSAEMLSPAIRFEPFVVSFNGPSSVGKSHLANRIAEQMMTSIDYRTYNELTYVRTPGNQYWNGLRNQPVCIFDDFLNIEDPNHALLQVGELYCLKSKAVFNPPMAAIEEKKIRYNPLLVLLCNNKPFPIVKGLALQEAWMRRREIMIEVRKLDEYKDVNVRQIPKKISKNYGHLRFCLYNNPAGRTPQEQALSKPPTDNYKDWMKFEEMNAYLGEKFIEYFEKECVQYDDAIVRLRKFHPDVDESTENFVKRVNEKVKELNEVRVKDKSDLEVIKNMLKDMNDNKYTADMTNYVRKRIIEKKTKETEKELDKQKLDAAQKVIDEIAKAKNTQQEQEKKKIDDAQKVIDEITKKFEEEKKKLDDDIAKALKVKSQADSDDDNGEINNEVIRVVTQMSKNLPPGLFAQIDKDKMLKVMDTYYSGTKYTDFSYMCSCGLMAPFIERVDLGTTELNSVITKHYEFVCDFSGVRENKYRNISIDTQVVIRFTMCSPSCYWTDFEFVTAVMNNNNISPSIKELQRDVIPKCVSDMFVKKKDTLELMTADEVNKVIHAEVADMKWYERLWDKVPSFGKIFGWICKLGALLAAIGALLRIAGYFFTSKKDVESDILRSDCENRYWENNLKSEVCKDPKQIDLRHYIHQGSQGYEEGAYSTGTAAAKPHAKVPIKHVAQASEQQEVVISDRIQRNTFWILARYTHNGVKKERMFRCLGLIKRYYILLDHYLFFLETALDLELFYVKENMSVPISKWCVFDTKRVMSSAICISNMNVKTIPQFKNIIKFIATSNATANLSPQASLYEMCMDQNSGRFVMKEHCFTRIGLKHRLDVTNDDNSVTIISSAYSYPYSGRGVCGSVLVTKTNCISPIIGIHVAGVANGQEGYAEAIVRETFTHLLDDGEVVVEEAELESLVSRDEEAKLSLSGNVELIGVVPREMSMHVAHKTRLINTINAGALTDITYVTPVLDRKDPRIADNPFSPLFEGCMHHTNPCYPMERQFVDRAVADVTNKVLSYVKPQRLNIGRLTVEQAVCGVLGNPVYEPMAMDTSEGFPWIKSRPAGMSNKSWMFERELTREGWILKDMYDPLRQKLVEREEGRRKGIAYEPIFVDTLKDAKLPKEKALIPGKTRVFSVSPVDFTIMLRQYSTDFTVAYTAARIEMEHGVGIDMASIETNKLVEHMLTYGNNMVCGDYSKFGDQLYANIVYAVYEMIWKWYKLNGVDDVEFHMVLKCFASETANATHLMLNLVYRSLGGMPSGNPLTVIINSLVNCCYVRIVWQKIMSVECIRMLSMESFADNVLVMTYGDDLWLSVKDEVKEIFNAKTMAKAFAEYNIKFTNATKGDELIPYESIYSPEVTFLKRTFHKHEWRQLWISRMEKRVVEETCNWTWSTQRDLQAASIEACKQMMELAYGHGSDYYEQLKGKVESFWQNRGVYIAIPDWNSIDMRIYDH